MFYKVCLIILISLFINFDIASMNNDYLVYLQETNTDFKEILKANSNRLFNSLASFYIIPNIYYSLKQDRYVNFAKLKFL